MLLAYYLALGSDVWQAGPIRVPRVLEASTRVLPVLLQVELQPLSQEGCRVLALRGISYSTRALE